MPKVSVRIFEGRPLLDVASYARRGPSRRDRLAPAEIAHIARTVRRAPEAMVKVLTTASNDLSAVGRHLDYIGRKGELELETEDGDRLSGRRIGHDLAVDWDLDLDEHRRQTALAPGLGRAPPKLVHKLIFSMPAGTPAEKVLSAVRNFAREEFWGQHRYAFALHVDEPHPHVHLVVKAVSERGVRLNIRKATLRAWRQEFAGHLRELGVEANATERSVRGQSRGNKLDGVYRAMRRGESTHFRERAEAVASELAKGSVAPEHGIFQLRLTRREVDQGWQAISDLLRQHGDARLADDVRRFHAEMSPAQTEKQSMAAQLLQRLPPRTSTRDKPILR